MYKLLDDLQIFTTMPKTTLNDLVEKSILDISNCIKESYETNEDCVIDIGIGTLTAEFAGDDVYFSFSPSRLLVESIINSVNNEKSDLQIAIENGCSEKMAKIYKDLF